MRVNRDKTLSRKSAAWYHAWWLAACALLALLIGAALKSTAWAAPGDLDPAFSGDGLQTTDFDGNIDLAYAVGVQSTGRIVVAGSAYSNTTNEFALVRYRLNGSRDTSFDGDGRVTTDFQNGSDNAHDLVILDDDKILVAGTAETTAGGSDLALARYNSDGSRDNSFSGNGRLATDLDGHIQLGYALALQQDGKILVAGSTRAPAGSSDFIVARYHRNGNLDTTFGGDGMVTTDFGGGSDVAYSVVVQPDGQIVVAGSATTSNLDVGLARYNPDGSLDTSFSFDGMATIDFDGGYDYADDVALDSSGRIIVVGGAEFSTINFGLVRLLADGSLDTTLSGNGKANTDFGGMDAATSLIVQPDGKLLVIGSSSAAPGGPNSFALARYRANGTLDTSFSTDGMVLTLFGQAYGGALLNDNRIVVVGVASNDFGAAVYQYDPPATATPTSTATGTATDTATDASAATVARTNVAIGTATTTPAAGAATCPMNFSDVLTTDYFYEPVRYLYAVASSQATRTRPSGHTTTQLVGS